MTKRSIQIKFLLSGVLAICLLPALAYGADAASGIGDGNANPTVAKGQADAVASGLIDKFGKKDTVEVKNTMNYQDCFDFKSKSVITGTCGCPYNCAPIYTVTLNYTEPTVLVEVTNQPGGGAISDVPGQGDMMGQFMTGSASGRTAPDASSSMVNMPTTGYQPNVYFETHVWGIGPMGYFEATRGDDADVSPPSQLQVKQSLSCLLLENMNSWSAPWDPNIQLNMLQEPMIEMMLQDWGTNWFSNSGSSQVSATTGKSFSLGIGNHTALVGALAGAVLGYAMSSSDPQYVCQAKDVMNQASTQAAQIAQNVQENPQFQQIAPKATYLPAGFNQVNVGYDTCPVTGVGHWLDDKNNIHFSNCDPQQRLIQYNCRSGAVQLTDKTGNAPVLKPGEDPCANGGGGGGGRGGAGNMVYRKAPSCDNRLSGFQIDGNYLACNNESTTYQTCNGLLTGSAEMRYFPGNAQLPASTPHVGDYTLCARQQGTRVVDQLSVHNADMYKQMQDGAALGQSETAQANAMLDQKAASLGATCQNGQAVSSGGSSGIGGAALGAAGGFAAGKLVESGALSGVSDTFNSFTSNIGSSISNSELGKTFSGMTSQIGGVLGSDGMLGGVTSALGKAGDLASLGNVNSATGALTSLNKATGGLDSIAGMTKNGQMGNALGSMAAAFSMKQVIPLYLSEMDEENWRSGDPISQAASGAAMASVPMAGSAMSFAGGSNDMTCGEVGAWGKLCPLRGFVGTSGNVIQASGLAGWRGYQKALPMITDKKRMAGKPTEFNLDYPHRSACFPVGTDSTEWESRMKSPMGLSGILGGLGSLFGAGGGDPSSALSDKRIADGVYVYTYWKDTACTFVVCTTGNQILYKKQLK